MESAFTFAHRHDVIWMSQNTNHIPTYPDVKDVITESIRMQEYSKYPHPDGIEGLKEAILEDLKLDDSFDVLITSGGLEAFYICTRALIKRGDVVVTTDPSFFTMHNHIWISGGKCTDTPVYEEPWKLKMDDFQDILSEKTRFVLFIDPLNPTGAGYTKDEVKSIAEISQDRNITIFNDVTYRDFAYEHYETHEFAPENSIIIYSFSKNCGLAGMRIGALICQKERMPLFKKYNTNELSVNVLAQRAALTSLRTKDKWIKSMLKITRNNLKRIKKAVDEVEGMFLPLYPVHANMCLIDIHDTGLDPDDIEKHLLYNYKIFIRSGRYVSPKLGHNFIRVSFSIPEEWAMRFEDIFPHAIEELRKH